MSVHATYLAAALLCYFAVIGWMLVRSDFLPYVTDNNESFSTLFHAKNLLRFGVRPTAGLTDEANSPDGAGHPYVYTHEGNFPRLPALALLLLGVDRIEWQITALALTVGGLTTVIAFKFFSRIAGDLFAFLAIAVFSTDYLLYVQWQLNTFRVWHALFLFVSLLCIREMNERNGRMLAAILFINSAALFYFEVVFALFVLIFSGVYAVMIHRDRPDRIAWSCVSIVLGGTTALSILLTQVFLHLGGERAWTDIRLTYLARSFGGGSGGVEAHWRKLHFFVRNHIAYWDSTTAEGFPRIAEIFENLRAGIERVYTPFLVLIVGLVSLSLALRGRAARACVLAFGRTALARLIVETLRSSEGRQWRVLLIATPVILAITAIAHLQLYNPSHVRFLAGIVQHHASGLGLQVTLAIALLWSSLWLSPGMPQGLAHAVRDVPRRVATYLAAGGIALVCTYAVFPEYVWNGYLSRYAPLPVFVTDVGVAVMFYVLLTVGRAGLQCLRERIANGRLQSRIWASHLEWGRSAALCACSFLLFILVALYWAAIQVVYAADLSPDAILFMRHLSRPEFKGTSFVSDNYALPIAYYTGQWAYQDQTVPQNIPEDTSRGQTMYISGKYIWLRDRETNLAYGRPTYYLCRINLTLNTVQAVAELPRGRRLDNCASQPIVRAASTATPAAPFRHVLVDHDPGRADTWAIVKLDPRVRLVPKD